MIGKFATIPRQKNIVRDGKLIKWKWREMTHSPEKVILKKRERYERER